MTEFDTSHAKLKIKENVRMVRDITWWHYRQNCSSHANIKYSHHGSIEVNLTVLYKLSKSNPS